MFLSKQQKIVFAFSLVVCSSLYSQTNNEIDNETITLQEISVQAYKNTAENVGGGG